MNNSEIKTQNYVLSVANGSKLEIALAALGLLALALRLMAIDSRGLWGDEAWRVWAARQPGFLDVLHTAWAQPPSAPLYWLGLHAWILIFGHGDVLVRLLSVPAAVALVPAAYWLGRRAVGETSGADRAGLLAAGLVAISPLAVEVGQEATMYAWTMLFATCALAAGLRLIQTGRGALLYIALGTLLLYTHYMGALLLGLFFLAGFTLPRSGYRRWEMAHLAIGLLWLPWLAAMGVRLAERWPELSQIHHWAGLPELYGSAVILSVSASAQAEWSPLRLAAVVLVGGGLLAVALARNRAPERRAVLLLAALVLAFIATIVGVSALTGVWLFQPRFLTLVLPITLSVLAAGGGGWEIGGRERETGSRGRETADSAHSKWELKTTHYALRTTHYVLLAVWIVAQAAGVWAFYTQPVHGRDGLREIGAWLTADVRPGDLVAANQGVLPWLVAQYYDGPIADLPVSLDVRDGYLLWPPPDQLHWAGPSYDVLTRDAAGARRIWLIYLPATDPGGELLTRVEARFPDIEARTYPLATVYLLSVPPGR